MAERWLAEKWGQKEQKNAKCRPWTLIKREPSKSVQNHGIRGKVPIGKAAAFHRTHNKPGKSPPFPLPSSVYAAVFPLSV
jgi:hypothetical protein